MKKQNPPLFGAGLLTAIGLGLGLALAIEKGSFVWGILIIFVSGLIGRIIDEQIK